MGLPGQRDVQNSDDFRGDWGWRETGSKDGEGRGEAMGCEIVRMGGWECICARVWMQRIGMDRVRYVMHY